MAAEFLKEIDRERNLERDEKYRDTLRHLWEKYQQQENEIEQDLFDEEKQREQERPFVDATPEINPQYYGSVVQKRRLVLPWLPATRRKRFPISKRSPVYPKEAAGISGTDEKVAKDLQAIFGESIDVNKRSSGDNHHIPSTTTSTTTTTVKPHKIEKKSDHSRNEDLNSQTKPNPSHVHDHNHNSDHDDDDQDHEHEHDSDHDHHHEHDHDHDEDDDDDFGDDDDDDDQMKKRSIAVAKRSNPEILKEDQIIPGDLSNFKKKKSIQWSKYFGIDRKKKSVDDWIINKQNSRENIEQPEYQPIHFRNHDQLTVPQSPSKNIELSEKKLENMDHKLKTIEELIIDETIKYTGAHEGKQFFFQNVSTIHFYLYKV